MEDFEGYPPLFLNFVKQEPLLLQLITEAAELISSIWYIYHFSSSAIWPLQQHFDKYLLPLRYINIRLVLLLERSSDRQEGQSDHSGILHLFLGWELLN